MIFLVFVRVCLAFTFCLDMPRYPKICQVFLALFRYALVLRYVPQRCPGCSQSGPQSSDLQGANQPQIRVQIMICRWFASTLDLHSDLQLANHDLQWFACKLPYNSSYDLHHPWQIRSASASSIWRPEPAVILTSFVCCTQGAGINFNHAGSVLSVIPY